MSVLESKLHAMANCYWCGDLIVHRKSGRWCLCPTPRQPHRVKDMIGRGKGNKTRWPHRRDDPTAWKEVFSVAGCAPTPPECGKPRLKTKAPSERTPASGTTGAFEMPPLGHPGGRMSVSDGLKPGVVNGEGWTPPTDRLS